MLIYKRILYRIACITQHVDDKTVVFESFQGRSYSCNPKAIYEAMKKSVEFEDFKFVWVFREPDKYKEMKASDTDIVKFESFEYYKALAKSKYWVFNSNTRAFLKPCKNQIFVQTWHGTPLKRIGCDVCRQGNAVTKLKDIAKNYTKEARKISYMISPSQYCTDKLVSAFNLKELNKQNIVLETGYPRNDKLFQFTDKEVSDIKNKYGISSDKKVILYAPTFRDNKHSQKEGFSLEIGIDFDKLKESLGEEYVVLFRAHYFIAKRINLKKYEGFVYDVSGVDDVNDLYIISDLLITDYSSVFFDYANLKRPIIFYMYDYEEYKNQVRDFYIGVDELPGPVINDQEELTKEIKKLSSEFKTDDSYKQFNKKYNYLDGADCGLKAAKAITQKV